MQVIHFAYNWAHWNGSAKAEDIALFFCVKETYFWNTCKNIGGTFLVTSNEVQDNFSSLSQPDPACLDVMVVMPSNSWAFLASGAVSFIW